MDANLTTEQMGGLIVSRKLGQAVHVGGAVVRVDRITKGNVRLRIQAPPTMIIMREEIADTPTPAA